MSLALKSFARHSLRHVAPVSPIARPLDKTQWDATQGKLGSQRVLYEADVRLR
jgi:hypothetical protein